MASAPTVLLLGCWLAGHSGGQGEREFSKPLIGGSPSWVVATGENVTIRCEGRQSGLEFVLLKAGHVTVYQHIESAGTAAEFPLPTVGWADTGSYTCEYRPITDPSRWSYASDPLELVVAEPSDPKPSISLSPSGGVSLGGAVSIRCRGQHPGRRFVLKREGGQFLHKDPGGFEAEFPLSSLRREQGGSYSCSYHSTSEPFTVSYHSDPVELVLRDDSGSSGSDGLSTPLIAGVSVAAIGLLLLLLLAAFVCFSRTQGRPRGRAPGPRSDLLMGDSGLCSSAGKGDAPRPNSTIPSGALKALAQQDPVYTSVDEGKQPQSMPQEPDPGAEGLTYAELDHQALQAKRGAPAPAPDPVLYAAVSRSQGARP